MIDLERIRAATSAIRAMHSLDEVLAVVQEEAGELVTEIARLKRGRATRESVCYEALDCLIVSISILDALRVPPELVEQKMRQIEGYPSRQRQT